MFMIVVLPSVLCTVHLTIQHELDLQWIPGPTWYLQLWWQQRLERCWLISCWFQERTFMWNKRIRAVVIFVSRNPSKYHMPTMKSARYYSDCLYDKYCHLLAGDEPLINSPSPGRLCDPQREKSQDSMGSNGSPCWPSHLEWDELVHKGIERTAQLLTCAKIGYVRNECLQAATRYLLKSNWFPCWRSARVPVGQSSTWS